MTRYHLSVLIPARNEYYYDIDLLYETVVNVLANTSKKTECVVVLDGYDNQWPNQPLPVDSRLTVIQHRKSIGQRAATNEAARVAQGEYVAKLDAHCALDENFDEKLLATFEPHWTVVPGQFNLQVFEWRCKRCDWTKDQSPKPAKCEQCGSRYLKQVKIWQPRDGKGGRRTAYTHSWRFDTNLDFQYHGAYASDEKYCKKNGIPFHPETQQPIHDTMSLLGACWAMRKDRYEYLEGLDESLGSWGDMGTELSCKVWLSGGELKVNQNTWFAHFFRVGGIGFPYPDGGRKERAKARGKEIWLNNKWPKQVYPLSWLIERFRPLPDWHTNDNPVLGQVNATGKKFRSLVPSPLGNFLADSTLPHPLTAVADGSREKMPANAVGFSPVDNRGNVSALKVDAIGNQVEMDRIAAPSIPTEMVQCGNISASASWQGTDKPSVNDSMDQRLPSAVGGSAVSGIVQSTDPIPAGVGDLDLGKQADNVLSVQGNNEIFLGSHDSASLHDAGLRSGPESRIQRDSGPTIITQKLPRKLCLYYTCNSHDLTLELAARNNLRASTNGHELGCVSLQRTDFGDWTLVLNREKSGGTMHYQILTGLERSTADYVFLCESDVLYHPSHFQFVPPDDSVIYYNTNVWRVRYSDGHAVRTANLQQVSGICANRLLLLAHYKRRVELIEANNGIFDVKRMAYEPGTRGKFGDEKIANWQSEFPNLDITGHGNTLTVPHFSIDSFRNKKYAEGWEETDDALPGWPKISGRVQEWLEELAHG
jgi:glycosyltransferase involved in cell wall biosynthesis